MTEEWQKRRAKDERTGMGNEGRTWVGMKEAWIFSRFERDGVRYAVRLIGRGLLSHLSYSRRSCGYPRQKKGRNERREILQKNSNPLFLWCANAGGMLDNLYSFFSFENIYFSTFIITTIVEQKYNVRLKATRMWIGRFYLETNIEKVFQVCKRLRTKDRVQNFRSTMLSFPRNGISIDFERSQRKTKLPVKYTNHRGN